MGAAGRRIPVSEGDLSALGRIQRRAAEPVHIRSDVPRKARCGRTKVPACESVEPMDVARASCPICLETMRGFSPAGVQEYFERQRALVSISSPGKKK